MSTPAEGRNHHRCRSYASLGTTEVNSNLTIFEEVEERVNRRPACLIGVTACDLATIGAEVGSLQTQD